MLITGEHYCAVGSTDRSTETWRVALTFRSAPEWLHRRVDVKELSSSRECHLIHLSGVRWPRMTTSKSRRLEDSSYCYWESLWDKIHEYGLIFVLNRDDQRRGLWRLLWSGWKPTCMGSRCLADSVRLLVAGSARCLGPAVSIADCRDKFAMG
jgi:hypothetical protein